MCKRIVPKPFGRADESVLDRQLDFDRSLATEELAPFKERGGHVVGQ